MTYSVYVDALQTELSKCQHRDSEDPPILKPEPSTEAVSIARDAYVQFEDADDLDHRALALAIDALVREERETQEEIQADFRKCYDLALMASSYWPELSGSWTGTVSERLQRTMRAEHDARESAEAALTRKDEALRRIMALCGEHEQEGYPRGDWWVARGICQEALSDGK